MYHIGEPINYTNQNKIDKMRKEIVNLGSKKCVNNDNYYPQLSRLHYSLLMRIVDTP